MTRIREFNSLADLAVFRRPWRDLLATTEHGSFFQTLEWLEVYWKHFGAEQHLRVLLEFDGDELVGVVPLVVRREQRKLGSVKILTYPLDDWGSFYGPLSADPSRTLAAAVEHIGATTCDWDLIELRWFAEGGAVDRASTSAFAKQGRKPQRQTRAETAVIDLPANWDEYLASRTSKFRNNLRRHQRRVAAKGKIGFRAFRPAGTARGDGDPNWELFDTCVELARRSWQGSSNDGTTLSHPEVADYLRDTHAVAADLGAVDLHVLTLDEQPLAFAYNYCWNGYLFGLRIGFDAERCRDGIGNLLYEHAIRHAIIQGDHLYDMGPGSLGYKRHLATRQIEIGQLTHYRLGVKAQALRLKHVFQDWAATTGEGSAAGAES